LDIKILENEYWWVGDVSTSHKMPFTDKTEQSIIFDGPREVEGNDQFAPLMLSSKGRYFWCDKPFNCKFNKGIIEISSPVEGELKEGYDDLKGAYLAAMEKHFPFTGETPDLEFFRVTQYNTWIELGANQTEAGILDFAENIVKNGLKPGVLMIDGGWQEDYGTYEFFNLRKIPHPKEMIAHLHELGFKVMVWVSPIVASQGVRFKELRNLGYLIRNKETKEPVIRKWWSGYSCVLDLSNPHCCAWFHQKLHSLMDNYGVDGFKFDAGDAYFYDNNDLNEGNLCDREQTQAFNAFGEKYAFNEFRAAWNYGGRAIMARLHDKDHAWYGQAGLESVVPHTIMQGLSGYAYCCPDMVGGGQIGSFEPGNTFDEELYIRWIEANALTTMMQVSAAPWRVLSKEMLDIAKEYIALHEKYAPMIQDLAIHASQTGEPIVRHMAYEFANEGFETCTTQFMLGSEILVAPVLEKGATKRMVKLPKGKWQSDLGEILEGGCTIETEVPLTRLPYYKKVSK